MTLVVLTFIFSMLLSIVLIPILSGVAQRTGILLDIPNKRKIHGRPIPKVGGIAMAVGIIASVIFWGEISQFVYAVLLAFGVLVFFGLLDDMVDLHFLFKFAGQFLAAFLVIFIGGLQLTDLGALLPGAGTLSPLLAIPFTVFVVVGVTNAINLADGLDGLAGGICMFTFMGIAYFAYSLDNTDITLLSLAVSGAIYGFLRYNTYPATIFMGDTGSQLLGFLAVTLSLKLTQSHGPVSPYVPLLLIGFPVLDTLAVMTQRIASGKSPFVADKNHLHHKLIKIGLFHSEAVFFIYVVQSIYVTAAYFLRFYPDWFVLSAYLLFSGLIAFLLAISEKKGLQVKRFSLVDKVIKGKLRRLRETNLLIKISFRFILVSLPLLLLFTCMLPTSIPAFFSIFSVGMIILISGVWLIRQEWLDVVICTALYISLPFIVYFSEIDQVPWIPQSVFYVYNLGGVVTIFFIVLTMKLTRRTDGLKATPLHFLILFTTLIIPNLPEVAFESYRMGMVAAKIIFFFFGFEVVIGELRNKMNWLGLVTLCSFFVLAVK